MGIPFISFLGPSHETTVTDKGKETEIDTIDHGLIVDREHIDKETGESHHHEVGHGWFGPFTGEEKK